MQQSTLFNSIKFFPTQKTLRGSNLSKPHLTYAISSSKIKNSSYTMNISMIAKKDKIDWDYMKIGTFGNHLVIAKASENDGHHISKGNHTIASKSLMTELLNFFGVAIPQTSGDRAVICFDYEKVSDDMYLLKRI